MKIPNKRELQQISINHSASNESLEKSTAKPYSFSVNDTTLASGNHLHFSCSLFERIYKVIMTFDDEISDEKLQYNINREASKIKSVIIRQN